MTAGKAKRPYRMKQRAASAEATRRRIIDAARLLWLVRWYDDISMREIAARAGVVLQTVVNHFGTKEAIFAAVLEPPVLEKLMARTNARPGDIPTAIRLLLQDYEETGDAIIRTLALEGRVPALQSNIDRGRALQRNWVESTFLPAASDLRDRERERRIDLLVCATDVYTWKLLRRDRGLSEEQTAAAIRQLVEALLR
jgi:AcrR family transcriptional regulator